MSAVPSFKDWMTSPALRGKPDSNPAQVPNTGIPGGQDRTVPPKALPAQPDDKLPVAEHPDSPMAHSDHQDDGLANGRKTTRSLPKVPGNLASPPSTFSHGLPPLRSERGQLSHVTLCKASPTKLFFALVVMQRERTRVKPLEYLSMVVPLHPNSGQTLQDLAVERLIPGTWLLTGFLHDPRSPSLYHDVHPGVQQLRSPMSPSEVVSPNSRKRVCRQVSGARLLGPKKDSQSGSDYDYADL